MINQKYNGLSGKFDLVGSVPLNNWQGIADPQSSDWQGYEAGSFWFNTTNLKMFMAYDVNILAEEAQWIRIDEPVDKIGIYTMLVSQVGTNAPTATPLFNNLVVTPTWSYVSPGVYKLSGGDLVNNAAIPYTFDINNNVVKIVRTAMGEHTITALGNNLLSNTLIEVKVYNA